MISIKIPKGPDLRQQSCSRKMRRGRIAVNIATLPELLGKT
jgi:hypothetical protein